MRQGLQVLRQALQVRQGLQVLRQALQVRQDLLVWRAKSTLLLRQALLAGQQHGPAQRLGA